MGNAIAHRGPDSNGEWFDRSSGIGLAHRRLSIIDLSTEGHQPMHSACGRFVIAFNGEIYNFRTLRNELESELRTTSWRGHSDTEVFLACISHWGVERALKKSNGMFAFALWDKRERSLILARDRFGEKPLYYGWADGIFLFGSELKAIKQCSQPGFDVDPDALGLLLQFNYIPAPYCIWQGLQKLQPGTSIRITESANGETRASEPQPYWSPIEAGLAGAAARRPIADKDAIDTVESALLDAVAMRMHADVPLGAFLSGGIDSSAVVAAMQAQNTQPVKTYSIAYADPEFDEGVHAQAVARHLGTSHTELRVDPSSAQSVIPLLPSIYDEPFADVSQIPTYLVSQLARSEVTVALSGDGGDELFGGYNRHSWGPKLWRRCGHVPLRARRWMAGAIQAVSPAAWDQVARCAGGIIPSLGSVRMPGFKLHKFANAFSARNSAEMYQRLVSFWSEPGTLVAGFGSPRPLMLNPDAWPTQLGLAEQMMIMDAATYLPDDILVKVDRASMAVSLEARVPFLDPNLFDVAWRLSPNQRIRNGQGKWALRQVLHKYVPRELIDRPKMGFGIPIGQWLRSELREWAESLLSIDSLNRSGLLDPQPIRRLWREHLTGKRDLEYHLWSVLMFQAWLQND